MLAEERKKYILTRLHAENSVRIKSLAEEMNVSIETVRRDIQKLHSQKLLMQVHGGALPLSKSPFRLNPALKIRQEAEISERRLIAQQAVTHLHKNEVIAINEGVTSDALAKALPSDYNLSVYTTSIPVAFILYERMHTGDFDGQVSILSGSIDTQRKAMNSELSFDLIRHLHFDKAFLSATAVDASGAMLTSYETGKAAEMLSQQASQHFLLASSSKFGYSSTYCYSPLNDFDCIITDSTHPLPVKITELIDHDSIQLEICT
ncbi:MAG: DeoR/GlpR transcriptional regulator [Clostridia bacterium]|nr:DeoR/GlpR transcriptional regulator [Clostridia bacterium]